MKTRSFKNEMNGDTWHLTYIDRTHFYASMNPERQGTPYHIGQMRGIPNVSPEFYARIDKWLERETPHDTLFDGEFLEP